MGILAQQGIEPKSQSIVGYLNALPPTSQNHQHLLGLFDQLASGDFARRELAMRQLIALPVISEKDLTDAADGGACEIQLRISQIIDARSKGNCSSSVAVACFRTICRQKLIGAAPAILGSLPLYHEEFVLAAARDALKATSRAEDLPLLLKSAVSGNIEARIAAIGALAALNASQNQSDLTAILEDDNPRIRLAAARALAERGDRACLAPLVALLSADDARVRHGSISTLRALTSRPSTFASWIEPKSQTDAIAGWQKWLADESRTAQLNHPLRAADIESGRTLACLYAKNQVIEFDAAGHETFSVSEPGGCPWACEGLPSGGRLVAMYSPNLIIEYGPDGKERVRISVPTGPMSVQRLDNGNTLVACNGDQKVVEVNDAGKIVWQVTLNGCPCDAVRLETGNTLVTLQNSNSVVEIDPSGKVIWKVEDLHTPRSASRLENGNTLICDLASGKVIEVDALGNQVWAIDNLSSPFGAQRLSDGTTVVSDTQSIKQFDRNGKVIAEKVQASLGRVWRY